MTSSNQKLNWDLGGGEALLPLLGINARTVLFNLGVITVLIKIDMMER